MQTTSLSIPAGCESEQIVHSRSSEVLAYEHEGQRWFLKIYRYESWKARLRGAFRNTFLAPSRAAREDRALRHLAASGVQPGLAGGYSEQRCLGLLREARLLSRGFGQLDLAQRLRQGPLDAAELGSLAEFLAALFDSGLRDQDLLARNLLLDTDQRRWAKIDASSSWILRRPLRCAERQNDLAALLRELAAAGQNPAQLAELKARACRC